jgi:hypothetical protein
MDMQLNMPREGRSQPDWYAAAASGFAAGAVLMVLELVWATTMSTDGPWRLSQLVAALTMGPAVAGPATTPMAGFDAGIVAVALVTHYALGIVFGLALAMILNGVHVEAGNFGMPMAIGAVFGTLLYLINFHVLTNWLPWFAELQGWATLVAHLVFGMTAAVLYGWLSRHTKGSRVRG